MNGAEVEFATQLATDAVGRTTNTFFKAAIASPQVLELRPAFQRNLVWNQRQKSYLVDSILRGLPVPEVYLQSLTDAEGLERLIVVDGQQRISTCVQFIAGELRLDDDSDLDARWRGRAFSELEDELKARFRSFKFIVRELPASLSESMLRDIFLRLNRTVEALEPQELRHAAFGGPFLALVERAGDALVLNELGVFSPKDYLRRRNDEFVSEVFFALYLGAFPNKKEGLDDLYLTFERQGMSDQASADLARRMGRAFQFLAALMPSLRRTRFRNKSDCYSLLVWLGNNAEALSSSTRFMADLLESLITFSYSVNELRKLNSQEGLDKAAAQDFAPAAVKYLAAVERAASDRTSRLRRNEALDETLRSLLGQEAPNSLRDSDEEWPLASEVDESTDTQTEREALNETLTR